VADVGVAISTVGRATALVRCLESLAEGALVPTTVAIVDQSGDGAAVRAAAAFADRLPLRLERQSERGLAVGQNAAVRLTSEPIFAVLDDDCVADRDWLATIAGVLGENGELGGVAGRVLPLGEPAAGLHAVSSRTGAARRDLGAEALPWDVGSGNNFALRREWFERVGGCDTRLGPGSPAKGGVDMDLFHRLLRAGARLRYEPDSVVYHERKSRRDRLERRVGYGHGMGAACGIWLREGDTDARRVLRAWVGLRARLLAGELRRGHVAALPEEALVLGSTAIGLVHGLRRGGSRG
jgi:GT2 family glycosyltransferase